MKYKEGTDTLIEEALNRFFRDSIIMKPNKEEKEDGENNKRAD